LVDQIEFADVLVVNKADLVDAATKARVLAVCKFLNPSAKVLESSYSRIDIKEIIQTGMFSFAKAATGAGWLRSLHELTLRENDGRMVVAPKPETEEYGIGSFVYKARRPFHPKRLYSLIHDKFILLQNVEKGDDDEEEKDYGDMDMSDAGSIEDEGTGLKEDTERGLEMHDYVEGENFDKDIATEVSALPRKIYAHNH
jgi:hypothetical protein